MRRKIHFMVITFGAVTLLFPQSVCMWFLSTFLVKYMLKIRSNKAMPQGPDFQKILGRT